MLISAPGHAPVLIAEVVAALTPVSGGIYVDATFGGGGYAQAILAAANCRLLGIDRDPAAVARGRAMAKDDGRLTILEGRFGDMQQLLAAAGITRVDGIVMDLGVSSYQLDDADRGFSFRQAGPLDMRMGGDGPSAADLVATMSEGELADVLHEYGDEPAARRIARAIVRERAKAPITRTDQLAKLVASVKGGAWKPRDPATQTFQAIRIAVNDELGELDRGLIAAEALLAPGGRLVVVSFHSAEDRRVKRFVDAAGGREVHGSRHLPPAQAVPARFAWVGRGVVKPMAIEVERNPRARSARLRVATRVADPEEDSSAGGMRRAA